MSLSIERLYAPSIDARAGEDDKTVELVTPPAGAKVGERVTVEGFAQPPLEAQLSGKVRWRR